MKVMLIDKVREIAKKINISFPETNVFLEYYNNTEDQACILIDNEDIFYSDEYAELIVNIKAEIEEYDINFSCLSLMRKLTNQAINLTEENKLADKQVLTIKNHLFIENLKEVYNNDFIYNEPIQQKVEGFFSTLNLTTENKYNDKHIFNIQNYLSIEKFKEIYNNFIYNEATQKEEKTFLKFNIGENKSWQVPQQMISKSKIMINTIIAA